MGRAQTANIFLLSKTGSSCHPRCYAIMLCYYDVPFLAMKNPNRGLPCHLNGHVTSLWLWMMDPVPSGRTFLRHGSVSSAHSAVILVYELKFLEFQEIRQSLSLWTHCQTPSHLIVGAANLSSEGGQPALPHHGLRCHPCQANGDGSCCSNLVIYHCQTLLLASRDWPTETKYFFW